MKIRCSMVISPNGYISKLDGDEDWIAEVNWDEFVKSAESYGNFIAGHTTYEVVPELDEIKAAHKVVVTSKNDIQAREGYEIVHSPKEAVDYLTAQGIEQILLIGGGHINAAFAELGLIDELELFVEPYLIGQGKQVLTPGDFGFPLDLLEVEKLSQGRVRLLYKVVK